ncbi:N-acetyltransferase family protein [Photobacterium sp. DNB22_13_2]
MRFNVRQAAIRDAEGIANVLNPIVEEGLYTVLDTTFTVEEEEVFIRSFPERGILTVAQHDESGKIAGFQAVEPFADYTRVFDHVGIIGTFVDGSFRRQGVAKRLFEATCEIAKAKGYEKLFAYVRSDNERALATYLNQGFEVIGTAKKHAKVRGAYVDEILIEKFL